MVRRKARILAVAISMVFLSPTFGQGTFQNLDFESASFVPIPGDPYRVEFGPALPGWTGYINGQKQTAIIPNGIPLGSTPIPFITVTTQPSLGYVLEGSHTLAYSGGFDSFGNWVLVSLAQTGQVPSDAQSLRFLALGYPAVLLDGHYLPPVALGSGPSPTTLYGVDISTFAGQAVELRFSIGPGIDYLDGIQFSNQPIPEPSTVGLFALGALLLGWGVVWRKA